MTVIISVDADGEQLWKGTFKKDTLSYIERGAFGINEGIPRLLQLFDDLNIKTTWFIPGMTAVNHPKSIKNVFDQGHEIAYHSMNHRSHTVFSQ